MLKAPVVWFLKSKSEEDKYSKLFEAHGYSVHFLPMLEFAFKNESKLEEIILNNEYYAGIILTSPRAAEALDRCIQHIRKRIDAEANVELNERLKNAVEYWQSHPLFAVGARTGSSCAEIEFKNKIVGESDAIELCSRIAQHGDFARPLLFLCGNLRRDELPNTLKARNIAYEELIVYETLQCKDALAVNTSRWQENVPNWVVFFSPSGVESMLSQYFPANHDFWKSVKIASIGQTTNQAIMRDSAFGRSADAVAQKPAPDALLEAISQAHNI